jgi:dTDP-4-dehydrorhamnose 3,5-epimerase
MKIIRPDDAPDLVVIEPEVHRDARGHFVEIWRQDRYAGAGIPRDFVQDNVSRSGRGVLRGLHFQHPAAQGKLVRVGRGEVFDVTVDLREGSPTFARWWSWVLSDHNQRQLWVPPGFGHGFLVLSDEADVEYKCTTYHAPAHDRALRWDDPDLGIAWPVDEPLLSDRDARAPSLRELRERGWLPRYPVATVPADDEGGRRA